MTERKYSPQFLEAESLIRGKETVPAGTIQKVASLKSQAPASEARLFDRLMGAVVTASPVDAR